MDVDEAKDGGGDARPGHIFLSYSRADNAIAMEVLALLKRAGFDVWWDGLIPGGDRFNAITHDALENAHAVVVLWSKTSVASHWVQDEATRGRDRACLVPLSIDGSEPPLGFRQFQYLDISGAGLKPDSPAMQRALAALATLFDRPATPLAPKSPQRTISRRTALLAGGGVTIAAAGGVAAWKLLGGGAAAVPNSIAVLPFDNLSGDPGKRYFSDGLSAELRAQLSRNPALSVMGQASSNEFRERKDDGRSIASQLDVSYLLDGNVRVAGDAVRIAVELIEGRTGFTKWSESFDGPMSDIFALQTRVAQAVDTNLAARLSHAAETRAQSGGSTNVAAFDAYLRGRALFESQMDEASDRAALAQFTEAARLDPAYAAARAARSRTLAVIANQYVQGAERITLYGQAVQEAQAAIRSAPEFADGHAALGYALFYGSLDVIAADGPYEKARQYGEGSADVLSRYALYRARRRQFDQAMSAIGRATRLDPLNPSVFKTEGLIRFARGDYEGAIASARHAQGINPNRATLNGDIGNALLMLDRLDDAAAAFAKEKAGLLALPGQAFVACRRKDEAATAKAFDALVRDYGDNGLYQQAQILAQWGKPAAALDALDKARAARDSGLVILLVDPFVAPLRSEPRYQALLRALHFV